MGKMSATHGSELHVLRFLGRHRDLLNLALIRTLAADGETAVQNLRWLEYPFEDREAPWDAELKSVDFLPDHGGEAWRGFWPDKRSGVVGRRGMPSWDAVCQLQIGDNREWLLVEAKAHIGELAPVNAACRAGRTSRSKIDAALKETYENLTPDDRKPWSEVSAAWLGNCYQKANRLACLHFLHRQGVRTHLLYIYFVGDTFIDSPRDRQGWDNSIQSLHDSLGLPRYGVKGVHELFLHVRSGDVL